MVDPNTIHFRSTFEHNPDPYTRTHNRILGPSFKTSPVEDLPTRRASLSLRRVDVSAPRVPEPTQINGGEALEGIAGTENRRLARENLTATKQDWRNEALTDPRDAKNPLAEAVHTKPKHQLGASRRHNTTLRQRSTLRIERRSLCMCLGKRKAGEDRRLNLGGNDCSPLSVRQSTLLFGLHRTVLHHIMSNFIQTKER
ncbi:hypothetical protein NPIL_211201 [Nephila pilipes]|uniref:Uncharacterized protein n=1 Tax=Nephila pilipes TaxID=299642 RepID=A0A8X6P5W2_NEPPI|nr:hypothetical protein NPIL_211201 [Nephila pilipes]